MSLPKASTGFLAASFTVTRTALELAGGPEAMNDRFASRLGAFMRAAGEPFDVSFTDGMIVALHTRPDLPSRLILVSAMLCEWRDKDAAVHYELTGYDVARGYLPMSGCDQLPLDDSFLLLFNAVRELIGEWPEMLAVIEPRRALLGNLQLLTSPWVGEVSVEHVLPAAAAGWSYPKC